MLEDIALAEFDPRMAADSPWQRVDVRDPWEVKTSVIAGTVCRPMTDILERLADQDQSSPNAVLYRSGGRSRRVAEFLLAAGVAKVANIAGGIDAQAQDLGRTMPPYQETPFYATPEQT
ncbi:MAG: rhodanese-like domain-containing protein [Woeseiaceae bacterium]